MSIKFDTVKRVYFVGIGGIGMSALARYFAKQGKVVCGYDRTQSSLTLELEQEGIRIHYIDKVYNIPRPFKDNKEETLVVYTPAVPKNHKELNFFIEKKYTVVKRAQALGVIAGVKKTLAVAGTHGKTTTSTLLAHLLSKSAIGCDAFLGGIAKNFKSNLVLGNQSSNLLVVEADEYDRSFLSLYPHVAIITSVDADHLDIYGNRNAIIDAFAAFTSQIIDSGTLIMKAGIDFHPNIKKHVRTYYYNVHNANGASDFYLDKIDFRDGFYHFDLVTPQGKVMGLRLGIPGMYNVENAIAASAAALLMGVTKEELREGLTTFAGVARRFDIQYRGKKTVYIDDYAHHPEELKAAINSVKMMYMNRKVTGIFQPHLFTRTRDFTEEFAQSLDLLDEVILLDIYPAREEPIPGITSSSILDLMKNPNKRLCSKEALLEIVKKEDIDILITMGAGDIDRLVPNIVEILTDRSL